ncbi:MAG: hypothetical protein WCO44_02365 [Bacteroidota bacterium]
MRQSKVILFLFFAAVTSFLTGCAKDSSTTTTTSTGRDAFLGSWSVTEFHTKLTYDAIISADPNSTNGVLISGFAGTVKTGPAAGAVVSGTKITLDANQVIDGLKYNGSGTLSGKTIAWNYTIDDGANVITAVATYTKK